MFRTTKASAGWMAGLLLAVTTAAAQAQLANPIFDEVTQRGIAIAGSLRKVRPPAVPDGLNAQQQQQVIEALIQTKTGAPITLAQFVEKNLRAPHIMTIDDLQYGTGVPGHSIDLYFTAHGNLKLISDPKFLQEQFKQNNKNRVDRLTAQQLAERQIQPLNSPGVTEYYAHTSIMIFPNDARVKVQATGHATETLNPPAPGNTMSVTLGTMIDPRFNTDREFPNIWQPVIRTPGASVNAAPNLGQATLYNGAGGYVKITTVLSNAAPPDTLLVEYHLVYDEPQAWFDGKNLLRSKLPQQAPDDVRDFRRKVEQAMKDAVTPKAE